MPNFAVSSTNDRRPSSRSSRNSQVGSRTGARLEQRIATLDGKGDGGLAQASAKCSASCATRPPRAAQGAAERNSETSGRGRERPGTRSREARAFPARSSSVRKAWSLVSEDPVSLRSASGSGGLSQPVRCPLEEIGRGSASGRRGCSRESRRARRSRSHPDRTPGPAGARRLLRQVRRGFAGRDRERAAARGQAVDGPADPGDGDQRVAPIRAAGARGRRQGRDAAAGRVHQRADLADQQDGARIDRDEPRSGGSSVPQ